MKHLLDVDYPQAETVTVVLDNLNTHDLASLYFTFDAPTASRLAKRLRLAFTPKNGSWLNVAEMELSILSRQCLGQQHFATAEELDSTVRVWQAQGNELKSETNWRFTTADARIKLKSLYPKPDIYR